MLNLKQKFLVITAHPDDLEMSCAGTVKRIITEGGSVTNWIMVKPMSDVRPGRTQEKVMEELGHSSTIIGQNLQIYDTKSYSNGRPRLELDSNIITELEKKISDFDVIISHWHEDYHQDHKVCYQIANILARKTFKQFACFDQPIYNRFYTAFNKNIYVDVTDYIKMKRKALQCYNSYFKEIDIDNIIDYNKYNGSFLGDNKFAETFNLIYTKQ